MNVAASTSRAAIAVAAAASTSVSAVSATAIRCSLRCQQRRLLSTSTVALAKTKKEKGQSPPPGPKNTPPGTNAKPPAAHRPKRYATRYGVPPLHPSLLATGVEKLSRTATEKAQSPDYKKLWTLEDQIVGGTTSKAREKARSELEQLRRGQPKRHPLWAFFAEKTQKEIDEEAKAGSGSSSSGQHSLAVSLQKPDAVAGNSGRSWHAEELRRKSFDDLHTLWYVLVVERNRLATQKEEARRQGVDWRSYTYLQEQMHRTRKSMARIKYVLNERRRAIVEAQNDIKIARAAEEASLSEQSDAETQDGPATSEIHHSSEPASSAPLIQPEAPAASEVRPTL